MNDSSAMKIGILLQLYRQARGIGLRPLAFEIGISHGTLRNIESGGPIDARTMLKLIIWLFS